jgi:hypothetical protein
VVAVSLLTIWLAPSIQDFMASNASWDGLVDFSAHYNAIQLDSLDALSNPTNAGLLISIPNLGYNNHDLDQIKQYVEAGNTLVLMDDSGYGNDILQYLGVSPRFNHSPLLDPLFCYKNQYFPRITDFSSFLTNGGINSIVLNHATCIDNVLPSQYLAWSSSSSFIDLDQNGSQDDSEPQGPLVVAARVKAGLGTIYLISDPSLIINSMEEQDNNSQFVSFLIGDSGSVLVDRSHLVKSNLDIAKMNLSSLRRAFSSPYALMGLVIVIFILVSSYTFKKGEIFG